MTPTVRVKSHEHVILVIGNFPDKVKVSTLEIRIENELFSLIFHCYCCQQCTLLIWGIVEFFCVHTWQLKVKILVQNGWVKFHWAHENFKSLFVREVVRVVELGKGEGISVNWHIFTILSLNRQLHQFIRVLLMHLVGVFEPGPNI